MFRNEDHILNVIHEQKESHLKLIKEMGELGSTVKKILAYLDTLSTTQTELITLSSGGTPFSANGYRFNSLYASDGHAQDNLKLIVKVDGLTYTQALAAGENVVNIPDGAQISITNTSGNPAALVLTRFNMLKS
jgi:hypothetical protein